MGKGLIAELTENERSYYEAHDVMRLLGVCESKAYKICRSLKKEYQERGLLSKDYPAGKVPKRIFNEKFMIC